MRDSFTDFLDREGNGAIELDGLVDPHPLMVFLAGPIKVWWEPGMWGSPGHLSYSRWRDEVRTACTQEGCLVYSPHLAWHGLWNEDAQRVNDAAIAASHLMINLTPPGVLASGTASEVTYARRLGIPVLDFPPCSDIHQLVAAIREAK